LICNCVEEIVFVYALFFSFISCHKNKF
jgi:hypothetical protein